MSAPRLRVLMSFTPDRGDLSVNPYTSLLERSLRATCDVHRFRWPLALSGRYDVLHCHWPEHLIGNPKRLRRTVAQILFAVLLVVLRVRRVAVVRTVHNVAPHEAPDPVSGWLLARLDALVDVRVHLHEPAELGERDHVFPHGDYAEWYAELPRAETVPGRLVHFGRIHRYKNVDGLLAAFAGVDDESLRLLVTGSVVDAGLERDLRRLAAPDDRVELRLGPLSDADLGEVITSGEAVVLPYAYLFNSGSLLLALTLGRPVIAPRSAMADGMVAEVGAPWVATYEPPLDAEGLRAAVTALRDSAPQRGEVPAFVDRDWHVQATRLEGVYRDAVAARRG